MDISDFVKKAKEYNVLGIKISKDNELAAEWYSEPECRRNIYSATKSFTSCAVGFAVQEGLIDLNEKLTEAFSGDLPECIDENLKEATVRDLLTLLPHLEVVSLRIFFCGTTVFADIQIVAVKTAAKAALPVRITADLFCFLLRNIFNFIRHIEFCIFVLRMPTIGTGFLTGSNPFIPTKRAIPETFDYLSHTDSPLPSLNNNFNKYLDFSSIL